MKRRRRAAAGLLVLVYVVGIAVAVLAFGSKTRYDCFTRRGASGILWCPESASEGPSLLRKSVMWPYYLAMAAQRSALAGAERSHSERRHR